MSALTHPSPNHSRRVCRVEAICVHWTGGSYEGTLSWICDPVSRVSYHAVISRTGEIATCVPWSRAAWAVGRSMQPDDKRFGFGTSGNSGTDNIALAGGPNVPPTVAQVDALVRLIGQRLVARGFLPYAHNVWRIVGHEDLAMPRGRKDDPTGRAWYRKTPGRVWIVLDNVRARVARLSDGGGE